MSNRAALGCSTCTSENDNSITDEVVSPGLQGWVIYYRIETRLILQSSRDRKQYFAMERWLQQKASDGPWTETLVEKDNAEEFETSAA